jgi:hypothetical protein
LQLKLGDNASPYEFLRTHRTPNRLHVAQNQPPSTATQRNTITIQICTDQVQGQSTPEVAVNKAEHRWVSDALVGPFGRPGG